MPFSKIKKQEFSKLKNTRQHDLYENINKFLPNADDTTKGIVAGLCIEYVIKSGGDSDIFVDELLVIDPEDEKETWD